MNQLFVEGFNDGGKLKVDLETLILIFISDVCDNVTLNVLYTDKGSKSFQIRSDFNYVVVKEPPLITKSCLWPVLVVENTAVSGLCSVARQIIKGSTEQKVNCLLGFRESSLIACSETSIWTKFCEVDMLTTVKEIVTDPSNFIRYGVFYIPKDLSRFEYHLKQPVRIHNVYKVARKKSGDKNIKSSVPIADLKVEHTYSEGPFITIADLLLFCYFEIIFCIFNIDTLEPELLLTTLWYRNMQRHELLPKLNFDFPVNKVHLPESIIFQQKISTESLYRGKAKRYKPQEQIFTNQKELDNSLVKLNGVSLMNEHEFFALDVTFDWSKVPAEACAEGGALPQDRAERKSEQLESLARAVLKIVGKESCTIVDFCSGSGHLGILLAVLLPNCDIILVENKETSLLRAKERVAKLRLNNVTLLQGNLDYFNANFDIGVSLHACGVATDLVMQTCVKNKAHFVCCPCCYGKIQECHNVNYPLSRVFRETKLTYRDYLILGHSADQTHDINNPKTKQGFLCMDVIDTDRKLYAQEHNYIVHLGKLQPVSCTPKNNLLVGICKPPLS